MGRYAEKTEVSVERSRAEIEAIVRRYGADGFVSGWEGSRAMVQFRCRGRYVRFLLTLPDPQDKQFTSYLRGSVRCQRTESAAREAWEQACRQKWRVLTLMVKAKLEAVAANIVTFEEEFLPHILMPDGKTVYEHTRAGVALAYDTGRMPRLLPPPEMEAGE